MMFDKRRHVAAAKSVFGQVGAQGDSRVQFVFHGLSGYKVTNFVWFVAFSFIQTVNTRNTRPFGPARTPRIRYFEPYSVSSKSSASKGRICSRMSEISRSAFSRE